MAAESVNIHFVSAGEQAQKCFPPRLKCYRESNGRPKRVAAADPIPHRKTIFGADTKTAGAFEVCSNGNHMFIDVSVFRAGGQQPGPRPQGVGEGFFCREGFRANNEECRLGV